MVSLNTRTVFHLRAGILPPQHVHAEFLQDRLVDQLPQLALGAERGPRQGLEVEEERLLHDVRGRQPLGNLTDDGRPHLDRPRLHRADDLMVVVELALVVDFDADRPFRLLLDLLLEQDHAAAHDRVGGGDLQADPEGYGLGGDA
jgi:hypothetical protein